MNFGTFWTDPRIPKRMKRCGLAPVRDALMKRRKRGAGDDLEERILASLPGYERHKPEYADFCMLSTYINQERDLVEWDEMDEAEDPVKYMSFEQRREHSRRLIEEAQAAGRYPRMVKG